MSDGTFSWRISTRLPDGRAAADRGISAWASSSHPIKGIEGLPMSGFLPYKQAHRYQIRTAATRSNLPRVNKALRTTPKPKQTVTAVGESQSARMFGNKCMRGLRLASGKTPEDENNSVPHGNSRRKC